jgi:hypothetical protein
MHETVNVISSGSMDDVHSLVGRSELKRIQPWHLVFLFLSMFMTLMSRQTHYGSGTFPACYLKESDMFKAGTRVVSVTNRRGRHDRARALPCHA